MTSPARVFLYGLAVLQIGCPRRHAPQPDQGEPAAAEVVPPAADGPCRELMGHANKKEARAWVRSGAGKLRTLGEQSNEMSRRIVDELYGRGATAVFAIDIESDAQLGETSNILCVALPDEPSARAQVLAYEAWIAEQEGFEGAKDVGQRYLFLYKFKF